MSCLVTWIKVDTEICVNEHESIDEISHETVMRYKIYCFRWFCTNIAMYLYILWFLCGLIYIYKEHKTVVVV